MRLVLCLLHQDGAAEAVCSYSFIGRNRTFSYSRDWTGTTLQLIVERLFVLGGM